MKIKRFEQINEAKELNFFEAFNMYIKGQTIDDYVSYPAYGTSTATDVAKRYFGEGVVCANGYKMISHGGGCSGEDCNTTFIIDDEGVLVARNEWLDKIIIQL